MNKNKIVYLILAVCSTYFCANAQIREYKIHDRGMLHETVFNTGEIGRGWAVGDAGNETSVPLMEWPSNSSTTIEGIEYSGQHNLVGAGVYIAANPKGKLGIDNRLYALCGAVGSSTAETVFNRWSFPIYMSKTENYPLNDDGTLNTNYDPDEAEQIIKAGWSTPTGITVYRTSRSWSYPDYDDLIIYEYEFEYTGDTDGDLTTIEMTDTLNDVMVAFNYGFYPSMYGAQRVYLQWKYEGGLYRGDVNNFWDSDYWLTWNMNLRNNLTDKNGLGKPEPDPDYFLEFAQSGEHGGGLNSPQAAGYCVLFYDTTNLAVVVPEALDTLGLNESEAQDILKSTTVTSLDDYDGICVYRTNSASYTWYYELDENYHIRQPWCNKVSTGNVNSTKMTSETNAINPYSRWSGVYGPGSTTFPIIKDGWYGRASYPYRQCADAGMKFHTFGPYTLKPGDKIHLAYAEVVGYGAEAGKKVEGGQTEVQWAEIPSLNREITYEEDDGTISVLTEAYLDEFGYPDYVNSDIINIQQVAAKAFQAYLGYEPEVPVWPGTFPSTGSYKIPIPPPAPILTLENYGLGEVLISWSRAQENFENTRLTGELTKYVVMRAVAGMGPWTILDSIDVGDTTYINDNDRYEYYDSDEYFKVGESRYYAVVSVDEHGNCSGKTNLSTFEKNISPVESLGKIYVTPNPFIRNSGFTSEDDGRFVVVYGLTKKCIIRIYSYAGQLVNTIEHNTDSYSHNISLVSRNYQDLASGIYFIVVTDEDGTQSHGKFIILK